MTVDINWWAVVVAALSSMVVGSLWYMPATFGNAWQRLSGVNIKKMRGDSNPAKMAWMYGTVLAASFVTAWVLAYVTSVSRNFLSDSYLSDAVWSSIILWVGFTAARVYVHDTFEGRRKKLTILNAMHELVTVVVMALIIGAWKP